MQGVAKFMEQRPRVVEAQQRRIGLHEVVVVEDDRAHHLAVERLVAFQAAGPGARTLAGPREIVLHEQADRLPIVLRHLEHAHIGMVRRQVGAGFEGQAEQPAGGIERRLRHVFQHEVWLDLGLVEVERGLANFLGVIAPVPGFQGRIGAPVALRLFQQGAFGFGLAPGASPDRLQLSVRRLHRPCHGIVNRKIGIGFVSHQPAQLAPQAKDLGNQRAVVVRTRMFAARGKRLIGLLPQVAAG